jgi:hypothetical protein
MSKFLELFKYFYLDKDNDNNWYVEPGAPSVEYRINGRPGYTKEDFNRLTDEQLKKEDLLDENGNVSEEIISDLCLLVSFENFQILEITKDYALVRCGGDWQAPTVFKVIEEDGKLVCDEKSVVKFSHYHLLYKSREELDNDEVLNFILNNIKKK